jgi:putative addiction module component (TIGR02574 family)
MNVEFSQIFELDVSKKLQLVEEIWDDLAAAPEQIPVLAWQQEELARRKAVYLQNPSGNMSWEEARERIRGRRG